LPYFNKELLKKSNNNNRKKELDEKNYGKPHKMYKNLLLSKKFMLKEYFDA